MFHFRGGDQFFDALVFDGFDDEADVVHGEVQVFGDDLAGEGLGNMIQDILMDLGHIMQVAVLAQDGVQHGVDINMDRMDRFFVRGFLFILVDKLQCIFEKTKFGGADAKGALS